MRFQAMDTNRDGVVSRAEWRGTDRAFRNRGLERRRRSVRRRSSPGRAATDQLEPGLEPDGRVDNLDSQISQRFRGYDMNNDNRVARSEWPGRRTPVHAA